MLVEFEMHSNSDCTAFIGLDSTDADKIACKCGCEFRDVGGNVVAKPRCAMSVAQNMHVFLPEVF
jgi:hypothetical protein